jgi:hypothetical protein
MCASPSCMPTRCPASGRPNCSGMRLSAQLLVPIWPQFCRPHPSRRQRTPDEHRVLSLAIKWFPGSIPSVSTFTQNSNRPPRRRAFRLETAHR